MIHAFSLDTRKEKKQENPVPHNKLYNAILNISVFWTFDILISVS